MSTILNNLLSTLTGPGPQLSGSPEDNPAPVDFAALLREQTQQAIRDRHNALMSQAARDKQRILEVGMTKFAEKQQEVKKLMKLLKILKAEAKGELKDKLGEFIDHFEQNPPANVEEMYDYIQTEIVALPENTFKHQMEKLFLHIQKLMELEEDELERLSKPDFEKLGF